MSLRIEHIDFDKNVVTLVIGAEDTPERVWTFALKCSSMGFTAVGRLDPDHNSRDWQGARANFTICDRDKLPPPKDDDHLSIGYKTTSAGHMVYQAACSDLIASLRALGDFAQLCGHALDLDERSMYRLRLCVTELATNSVDHGVFGEDAAMARVEIRVRARTLQVRYEDNSEPFDPSDTPNVRISEKFNEKDSRGFGLYMLRRLVNTMKFSRKSGWNRTTLTINWHTKRVPQLTGDK